MKKGLGLISALMAVIVIAIIAVGGTLIYKHNHKKITNSTTPTPVSTSTSTVSPNQTAPTPHTGTEAVNTVQKAYDTALAYVKSTTNAGQGEIDSIKGYLTTDIYNKLTNNVGAGRDQILCSQMRPDSVSAVLGTSSSADATAFVNEAFGSSIQKITTTVDLSTLKISSIACPQ